MSAPPVDRFDYSARSADWNGTPDLVVRSNAWEDYTVYMRSGQGRNWTRVGRVGSLSNRTFKFPDVVMQGSNAVYIRLESRLWKDAWEFQPFQVPLGARAVHLVIQNLLSTSYIQWQ